jgi:hypothetical protein
LPDFGSARLRSPLGAKSRQHYLRLWVRKEFEDEQHLDFRHAAESAHLNRNAKKPIASSSQGKSREEREERVVVIVSGCEIRMKDRGTEKDSNTDKGSGLPDSFQ